MKRLVLSSLQRSIHLSGTIHRRLSRPEELAQVRLRPPGPVRGQILLAHRIEGFLREHEDPLLKTHNHFGEAAAMAAGLLERGYVVDVISHMRRRFRPRERYDLFIGCRETFEEVAATLPADCVKVVHLDTAHWVYNNHASLGRSLEVQHRSGITPERHITVDPNSAIECADYATVLGNDFVYGTYAFSGKAIFEIANPATIASAWMPDKDFEACRRRFIWLGSRGLAHKGLGRVLEAFAGMQELHLTVCGPLAHEPEFCRAYRRELEHAPNIQVYGWIDVTSAAFRALARSSLGVVFPSCAEAQAGAVINCMQAGLIPLVSRQVGLDVSSEFGVLLCDDSVKGIREAVRRLAERGADELAAMSRSTWEMVQANHTHARYQKVFGATVDRILGERPDSSAGFVRLPRPSPPLGPRLRAFG